MKTKICKKAGCGRTAEPGKDYCKQHLTLQGQRKVFNKRGKSGQYHSMYESQDLTLFYDDNNLQPMCQSCHSRKTMKENNNFHRPSGQGG